MARALAQEPQILLLDEPTNHLDVRHRFEALHQVRALGITVVATLHELEAAGRLCDRLILLHRGSVVADGEPADVLTPDNIERVYDVDASVDRHPTTRQIPHRPSAPMPRVLAVKSLKILSIILPAAFASTPASCSRAYPVTNRELL